MKDGTLSNSQPVGSKRNFMSTVTTFRSVQLISLLLTLIIFAAATSAVAQSILDSGTPVGVAPGAPAGSYALSDIENINLFSGNLNFTLPLQKVGGRGGAQSAIMLPIESHWTNFYFFRDGSGAYYNPTPWQNVNFTGIDSGPGYGPGKLVLRGERANNDIYCPGQGAGNSVYDRRSTLYFGAPGGTEFELRDTLTGGAPRTAGGCNGSQSYASRGTVFVTTDGTSATFVSDTTIYDNYNFTSNLFGYLTMRDGTRYRIDNGLVSWIRDRNGNQLTYTYTNGRVTLIKDSLGRETTFEYRVNDIAPYGLCDRITFKGSGGQPRIIRVSYYDSDKRGRLPHHPLPPARDTHATRE